MTPYGTKLLHLIDEYIADLHFDGFETVRQHIEQGEPLPKSYLSSILTSMPDGTTKVSLFFGDAQEAEEWFDALTVWQEKK